MASASLRSILRAPGVGYLLGASLVARLPAAMTGLAIVLRVSHGTGSYASAGAVTATFVVGAAVLGPLLGRLADRLGRRPVLATSAVVNAAGLFALAEIPVHSSGPLLGVAAFAGASTPPVAAAIRSLWPELVPAEARDGLYAADSTMQELTFVVGPALVALVGGIWGSSAPLVATSFLGLTGNVAVVLHPAVGRPAHSEVHLDARRVLSGPLVSLLVAAALLIASFGALEIGIVAFAAAHHARSQSGLLLGVWSLGSMFGGLATGSRATAAGARALAPLLGAVGAGFVLLLAAPGPALLYPLLLVAGLPIAPGLGCVYGLAGRYAPPGAAVEAFSWLSSAVLAGAAGGAALGGVVVQHLGSHPDELVAAAGALAAAAVSLLLPARVPAPARAASPG